ncbi:MAG TPA: HlyD family efflux transporter periplasmic adaptor subunit, partial [Tepidisphaeraceae bacterium]|nr:HlyD family efflux transporter periplasmic adaptor subunit [Tepidisphaeraceae bacterium]
GDVLFEFDSRKAQAELRIAEATTQLAESELSHVGDKMGDNGPNVKAQRETYRAKLEIAQANLDLAKLALERMRITAPFDGVIQTRFTAGQRVDAGTDIGELIKMDELGVSFELPQSLVGQVKVGQEIEVRAPESRPIKAQVNSISPIFNVSMRSVSTNARLVERSSRLLPGMRVTVSFQPAAPADEKPELRNR